MLKIAFAEAIVGSHRSAPRRCSAQFSEDKQLQRLQDKQLQPRPPCLPLVSASEAGSPVSRAPGSGLLQSVTSWLSLQSLRCRDGLVAKRRPRNQPVDHKGRCLPRSRWSAYLKGEPRGVTERTCALLTGQGSNLSFATAELDFAVSWSAPQCPHLLKLDNYTYLVELYELNGIRCESPSHGTWTIIGTQDMWMYAPHPRIRKNTVFPAYRQPNNMSF